jgi:hypothetical protein
MAAQLERAQSNGEADLSRLLAGDDTWEVA